MRYLITPYNPAEVYKVMVGERANTFSRKRNVGKTEAKRVFGTKTYSQYQVLVTVFSAYNILHNNGQKQIEEELETLLFVKEYRIMS